MTLATFKCYAHVVQTCNGLKLELKRFHRAAQEFSIAISKSTTKATAITPTENFRDHIVARSNGWNKSLAWLAAGGSCQSRSRRLAYSGFRWRLMTAMLRSSNGGSNLLALKAVQNCGRRRGFARLSPWYCIARGIGCSAESAVPDRLRGGYLRPSPASFGNSGP